MGSLHPSQHVKAGRLSIPPEPPSTQMYRYFRGILAIPQDLGMHTFLGVGWEVATLVALPGFAFQKAGDLSQICSISGFNTIPGMGLAWSHTREALAAMIRESKG